jgi:hypothetical protein
VPFLTLHLLALQEGLVTHRVLTNYTALELELREATCHIESPAFKQLIAYDLCLHNYGARHQFMGGVVGRHARVVYRGRRACCACPPPPVALEHSSSSSPWLSPPSSPLALSRLS